MLAHLLAAFAQDAAPVVRTEPLPLEPVPVVALVAAPHPDPESLPDGVVLEVVGRIDRPDLRDAVGVVRAAIGPGATEDGSESSWRPVPYASIEPDGSFFLEVRWKWPAAEPARRLELWTSAPEPTMPVPAPAHWSFTHDITVEPLPGFRARWDLTADGDGPWRVDVGTLALAPAPVVLEARITAPGGAHGSPIVATVCGGASPTGWHAFMMPFRSTHSDRIQFPSDEIVRLHSWSPPRSSAFHLARSFASTDGRMLWSPSFTLPARITCALVHPLDLEFRVAPAAPEWNTTSFLGLVPTERADEIEAYDSFLMGPFWPHERRSGRGIGKPIRWVRHFADAADVPPDRYELVYLRSQASDFVHRMTHGPLNPSTIHPVTAVRLGALDLRERSGTVRVAIDLEANSARILPREDAEPVSDGDEER